MNTDLSGSRRHSFWTRQNLFSAPGLLSARGFFVQVKELGLQAPNSHRARRPFGSLLHGPLVPPENWGIRLLGPGRWMEGWMSSPGTLLEPFPLPRSALLLADPGFQPRPFLWGFSLPSCQDLIVAVYPFPVTPLLAGAFAQAAENVRAQAENTALPLRNRQLRVL